MSLTRKRKRDAMRIAAKMNPAARDALVKIADHEIDLQQETNNLVANVNNMFIKKQQQIEDNALVAASAFFLWCLHDKWGWNRTRLKRLTDQVKDLSDGFRCAGVKLKDVLEQLRQETKIDVQGGNGENPFVLGGEPAIREIFKEIDRQLDKEKAAGDGGTSTTAQA